MTPTLALLALLAFQCSGNNCPGGVCLPPGYLPMPQPPDLGPAAWPPRAVTVPPGTMDGLPTPGTSYRWEWHEGHQQYNLRDQSGRQVGGFKDGIYRDYLGNDLWSEPRAPRIAPPGGPPPAGQFLGVDLNRIAPPQGAAMLITGNESNKPMTIQEARGKVGPIPDRTKTRRLVLVGPDAKTKPLAAGAGEMKGTLIQCYEPNSPMLRDPRTKQSLGYDLPAGATIGAFWVEPPNDKGKGRMIEKAFDGQVPTMIGNVRERDKDFDLAKVPRTGGTFGVDLGVEPVHLFAGLSALAAVVTALRGNK